MERPRFTLLRSSLALYAGSIVLALVSTALGREVNDLDQLTFFNVMAAAMLVLAAGALLL